MVVGARMCGTFITKKVPIGLLVGVVAFVITGSVCLGMYNNYDCYNYYSCTSYYRDNLLISGISCMVSAGVMLVVALGMFYKIHNAPQDQPYPTIGVGQGAALPHQPYSYPAQQPHIGFTIQQQQQQQQQQQHQQQQQQQQQYPPAYYT